MGDEVRSQVFSIGSIEAINFFRLFCIIKKGFGQRRTNPL